MQATDLRFAFEWFDGELRRPARLHHRGTPAEGYRTPTSSKMERACPPSRRCWPRASAAPRPEEAGRWPSCSKYSSKASLMYFPTETCQTCKCAARRGGTTARLGQAQEFRSSLSASHRSCAQGAHRSCAAPCACRSFFRRSGGWTTLMMKTWRCAHAPAAIRP